MQVNKTVLSQQEFSRLVDMYLKSKRDSMRQEYDRVLPTGELLFNRFDKAAYLNCGKDSSIYDASIIIGDVKIGNHVWVGPYTVLDGSGGRLYIGDYVSINAGVMVYSHDSTKNYLSGGVNPFEKGDVVIENNVVIGSMSIVTCGVSIGNHSLICANSFVNESIPEYSIVAGTPAKIIGRVIINQDGSAGFEYNS